MISMQKHCHIGQRELQLGNASEQYITLDSSQKYFVESKIKMLASYAVTC